MAKFIQPSERPHIPCEHPDIKLRLQSFKQNLIRLKYKKADFTQRDSEIESIFAHKGELKNQCDSLVSYVAEAFQHYAVWDYTHAYYPGYCSQQTARLDAMEGCSRVLPTLAAWLHANKSNKTGLYSLDHKPLDVADWMRQAFLAGTDPEHVGYWGDIEDYDQRICESADLALALWLSREQVWASFSVAQQRQIMSWFEQVNQAKTVDNNWHLFPLTVQLVVKALTGKDCIDHQRYARIKEFYVGDGWFRDGAKGNYDYYNAWGFHYSLYWLNQIQPDFDPDFICGGLQSFSAHFRYLFTAQGFPMFGRSACYRLAATAPLLATLDGCDNAQSQEYLGQFKRAFSTSLDFFITNGALKKGRPTQGLFADDVRLTDNYSGPASSFWSLRAVNIAIYCGDRVGLWSAEETPLQIEKESFTFSLNGPNILVVGVQETQEVTVLFKEEYASQPTLLNRRLEQQTFFNQIKERLSGRAERPKNNLLRKGVTCYSSKMSLFL
ncbi:hypothetical protein VII00023_12231 [Vibrio ichthyoenteri ATCC 700023]|uniref:DUF2264 domain-containing protein n=1 Tax=Vibrio ichthyoenteri ATCC 700023 TaxID=870968 RepID=F9S6N8_9VIBR|nr:DUF2264 domain-containing protein [Vibrio ichthyoenteri]EGU32588.1 hypothetical protein VII00023_12231 [Vibrio ichthyoenteri ATCC 700023]